jgi:hypothetical protein
MFCYSLEGECGQSAPKTGDTVCLSEAPDGSRSQQVQCLNDPCCIPCPEEPVAEQARSAES